MSTVEKLNCRAFDEDVQIVCQKMNKILESVLFNFNSIMVIGIAVCIFICILSMIFSGMAIFSAIGDRSKKTDDETIGYR